MKKIIILILSFTVFVFIGCDKGFYDVNTNPNAPTNASVDLVLSNALKVTASGQVTGYDFLNIWLGYWCNNGSYAVSSDDISSYKVTGTFADEDRIGIFNDIGNNGGLWSGLYHNLENYEYIEKTATTTNKYFYIAAAKTMKAYVYQQLVDMFNNVPYNDALQGTALIQPTYDNGKAIYEAIASNLDAAVVLFKRSDALGSATQDVLFSGDNSKWIKFANTLKLRILMRQTQMPSRAAYIQTEINKIVSNGGGFLTADAAVNPGYLNSGGKQNPFYGYCINIAGTYTQDRVRANAYVIDFCSNPTLNNNDPRYKQMYAPNDAGNWVGGKIGLTTNPTKCSVFGSGVLKSSSQSAVIMSASESYFLQAEAGLKSFMSNNPASLFNAGVQSNFTFLGSGNAGSYTSQNNKETNYSACATDAERLACIIRQKWMANNFTTPFESWGDYRRLGLPVLPITGNAGAAGPTIPIRILYPNNEFQTNATNVAAQGVVNQFTSKIFWMP